MNKRKRRKIDAALKAKVALEVIREQEERTDTLGFNHTIPTAGPKLANDWPWVTHLP